jgi:hypothetical protein
MRVIGLEIPSSVTGGLPTFVPTGALTVLFGANDTGKTRLLRAIDRGLRTRGLGQPGDPAINTAPRVYLELGGSALPWADEVFDMNDRDVPAARRDLHVFGQRIVDLWSADAFDIRAEVVFRRPWSGLEYYTWLLRDLSGLTSERWDPLFDALTESQHACARLASGENYSGWAMDWCLSHDVAVLPEIASLLLDLNVPISELTFRPVPVAPLVPWLTDGRGLPDVLTLPSGPDELQALVSESCAEALSALAEVAVDPAPMLHQLLEYFIRARLPTFVTGRYDVAVTIAESGSETHFRLRGHGPALQTRDMADGYKLWLELALREAAGSIPRAAEQLRAIASYDAELPVEGSGGIAAYKWLMGFNRDLPAAIAADPEVAVEVLAPLLRRLATDRNKKLAWSYAGRPQSSGLSSVAGSRQHAPPLVLVDEPERHLHPSLVRAAADFLEAAANGRLFEAQLVLVSHSPALLTLDGDVSYAQVSRDTGATIVAPFAAADQAALRRLSDDLGLDRGELLTRYRVIAFVEGYVDQVVFETLFGERLRRVGVKVVPMHGTTRMAAIPEADVLFEELRQRIVVVVDGVVRERMPDPRDREGLVALANDRRTKPAELRKVAQLLAAAADRGRRVEALSIEGPDIIAELDEDVLRDVQELGYPGHEFTLARWQKALRNDPNVSWKGLCERAEELNADPTAIQPVVVEMRRRGVHTSGNLVEVVERLEGSSRHE